MSPKSLKEKLKKKILGRKNDKVSFDDNTLEHIEKFNNYFKEIDKRFIQRAPVISSIKLALATKQHVLMHGKPGTAKSQLAKTVFDNIDGGDSVFAIQLKKGMGEEHFFGGIDMSQINEKIVYNTKGSIVSKRFAFIDELFDASGPLIRSLLEVLNERTFTTGYQHEKCLLHTCLATSNFFIDDDEMAAVLSRFLFHVDVKRVKGSAARVNLFELFLNDEKKEIENLSFETIEAVSDAVCKIKIDNKVLRLYDSVLSEWEEQRSREIYDRNSVMNLRVLQAQAVLNGQTEVDERAFEGLRYVITKVGDDEESILFDTIMEKTVGTYEAMDEHRGDIDAIEKTFVAMRSKMNVAEDMSLDELKKTKKKVQKVYQELAGRHETDSDKINELFDEYKQEAREVSRVLTNMVEAK